MTMPALPITSAPSVSRRVTTPGRQTRPENWHPYMGGGIGFIPRRHVPEALNCDPQALSTGLKLRHAFDAGHLFRVFEVLLDLHPGLKQAKSNMLRLTVGRTKYVVYRESGQGGQEGDDTRDDALTSEAEDLLKAQPPEIGGAVGLQTAFLIAALTPGMVCMEAVPGPRGTGIRRFWPVDPLTIELGRPGKDPDADIAAYQRQSGATEPVQLNPETFYWSAIDATPGNPHGSGIFSAAFNTALADMAMNRNLLDAVRNAAWPRILYQYLLERLVKEGTQVRNKDYLTVGDDGLTDLDRFIRDEINTAKSELALAYADDNPIISEDWKITPFAPGSFQGLEGVLEMERSRFIQSVDMMPGMMGVTNRTETFGSVEWQLMAGKAEALAEVIDRPICWGLELHFRLKGQVVTVRAEREPVRTVDVVQEANAEATKTNTIGMWEDRGYIDHDEASSKLTGSKATGTPKPEPVTVPANGSGGQSSVQPGNGTSAEERSANP